jgi:hypothetical protein
LDEIAVSQGGSSEIAEENFDQNLFGKIPTITSVAKAK